MGKRNRTPTKKPFKLTREQQIQVCVWAAMGWGATQICEHALVEWNLTLNRSSIHTDYLSPSAPLKWRRLIRALRSRLIDSVAAIPIAHKSYRLAQLQDALIEARRWRLKSITQWGKVHEQKFGAVASLIEQARKEVDGEGPMIEAPTIIILGKLAGVATNGAPELVGSGRLNGR